MLIRLFVISLMFFFTLSPAHSQHIPSPKDFLGYSVGEDFKLARWEKIVEYFHLVSQGSGRVLVEEIARTTEDNPYILATISSSDNMRNLDKYKRCQRLLSHPNEIPPGERERILNEARTVVLISCAIHSSEIASSQLAMELLYQLAVDNNERTLEILQNDIILLVPSANPDGINKVIDWYERSLGKPWEGQGMPWLYQKYVGHDDNRDWFMVTQKETRILTDVLYRQWYPCILYDLHQMGNSGCRFFLPPFFDPVNPNVDPVIHESLKIIGGHMATELAENGKKGVLTNAIYDNWWHGGNRTTPYRHNIVGLLTEAASPRIASPIFQRKSELRGYTRGLPRYEPQVNFADPWDGGWWRLRDVVDYEEIACYALFTVAARYRDRFNRNYLNLGEKAIRLGNDIPPYAFLVSPHHQRDLSSAIRLLQILQVGGVDVSIADEAFSADGVNYEKGTYIIFAAQPYRNHLKDLLEPQDYPDRFLYPGGPAEPPYDVAGWTLSYQMGVEVVQVHRPFTANTRIVDSVSMPPGSVNGSGPVFVSTNQTTNDFIFINRSLKHGMSLSVLTAPWEHRGNDFPAGSLLAETASPSDGKQIRGWIRELGLHLVRNSSKPKNEQLLAIVKPRLGLYYSWAASMDEGWTRFVLEQFEFDFVSLYNADIRAGNLKDRYDVIVIPDVGTSTIMNGMKESTSAPEYVGGIGEVGVAHLQDFVARGGRLICLDSSCPFAIRYFDLPLKNVLSGLKQSEFFCAGSILRINLNPSSTLAYGMPFRSAAYFSRSYAFAPADNDREIGYGPTIGDPAVIATYDNTVPLLSGWILGENHLKNKAAIVSVPYGGGEIVLYAFRVQHRAQTHGTFRLLFNGILLGGV